MKKKFVGEFDELAIRRGDDKAAIEKLKIETGLQYIDSKIVGKGKKKRLNVWLVDRDTMISTDNLMMP